MKHHTISAGSLKLHMVETGNSKGCPILFIHGFSQCWLAWNRQLNSDLANDHRLIAMDLRGHGLSDKPSDGYTDSRLLANDVNAVIKNSRFRSSHSLRVAMRITNYSPQIPETESFNTTAGDATRKMTKAETSHQDGI